MMNSLSDHIKTCLERLNSGSHDTIEIIYSSTQSWPLLVDSSIGNRPIRISVFDSSFNPPTKAHFELAASELPGSASEYDAQLLLLSTTNADKKLKPGDATYYQRLEMMVLLAKELELKPTRTGVQRNVCVAAIDEPTFVGKSKKLQQILQQKHSQASCQLYFIVGFDTITRLFDTRFYGSQEKMQELLDQFFSSKLNGGDDSQVVVASRILNSTEGPSQEGFGKVGDEDDEFFLSKDVKRYYESGKITKINMDETIQKMSSTRIRQICSSTPLDLQELTNLMIPSIVEFVSRERLYGLEQFSQTP